jgi:hypothetical protein
MISESLAVPHNFVCVVSQSIATTGIKKRKTPMDYSQQEPLHVSDEIKRGIVFDWVMGTHKSWEDKFFHAADGS